VRGRVLRPVRPVEPEVERGGVGAQHAGQHVEDRADLATPVLGGLHDLRVQAHGGVVHEDPVADQGEVDPPLGRRSERVQGTHHVVSIEPEVHGQVVSGPRGHADERDVVSHGHAGHEGLRTVPAGHPNHIGAPGDGILGQPHQVVSLAQHDGLDAPFARFLNQSEALHLSVP